MNSAESATARKLIQQAFEEDLQDGVDLTTVNLVPAEALGAVKVVSRACGVLSGAVIAQQAFEHNDPRIEYSPILHDGAPLVLGSVIAEIQGPMRSILTAERTALNFLTLLSGVASSTHEFVEAVLGTPAQILDTRKTLPGLRHLQKFAVRCGGGSNHRRGLFDAVLIKDNHLAWWKHNGAATLGDAVRMMRKRIPDGTIVEIEVDNIAQFREVLEASPDIILLDNMSDSQLRQAVQERNSSHLAVQLEASGGINLNNVSGVARTGVDRISVGALTHSAVALDIGLDWSESLI